MTPSPTSVQSQPWFYVSVTVLDWLHDLRHHGEDVPSSHAQALCDFLLPFLYSMAWECQGDGPAVASLSPAQRPPDLTTSAVWGPQVTLPKATCILSESHEWEFDLQNSDKALDWLLRRVMELWNLKCLPAEAACANFPSSADGAQSANSIFGPFNGVGLVIDLKACEDLSFEVVCLSIPTRVKWLRYLNRDGTRIQVTRFPPITHATAVMVGEVEFTDKVAMDLYGQFTCSVDVKVERGLLPSFGATSDTDCEAITLPSGCLTLDCVNGATVLFIACLVLRAESAVLKLLDMDATGRIILNDLAEHGLLWMMRAQNIRAIIGRWLEQTDYHLTFPPPHSKLSLLLRARLRRPGGPSAAGESASPLLLFQPATGADARTAGRVIASGVFYGCAVGTAIAVRLNSRAALIKTQDATSDASVWVDQLFADTLELGGEEPLMCKPTIAATKTYLQKLLGSATPQEIEHVDRPRVEVLSRLAPPPVEQPGDQARRPLFLHHFYRAFFVSVTGGRLRDDGENPLKWCEEPLEKYKIRQSCLSPAKHLAKEDCCSDLKDNRRALPFFMLLAACALCGATLAMLWASSSVGPVSFSTVLSPGDAEEWIGIGEVKSSFKASKSMKVSADEKVHILAGNIGGHYYKIRNVKGREGVSAPQPCNADASSSP